MSTSETEGHWDVVITSLQDICNANESSSFDNTYKEYVKKSLSQLNDTEVEELRKEVIEHKSNIETSKRLASTAQKHLQTLISNLQKNSSNVQTPSRSQKGVHPSANGGRASKRGNGKKMGRSFYSSRYNPSEPIYVGSEVAYRLKNRHFEEWIQCEVMKVIGEGVRFEIRDPEPDENNNPGQTFKANHKEIILIPTEEDAPSLPMYPEGTKVLARYPETTTFYPAIVVGHKRGYVRLKFDGEEEVNKEIESERRLVLPFPEK
ncbi:Piso0_001582 [Millerozyma farinosa CBS 7064]|uniref:Piso0_001582 protein n=1 Tax=Pichia sorbitophila (strain ATCC MYA-4447 / BCRC 22081 / CBS 7064 / NBRC 10061 / NRRL Y-12695) TaxID=559304 RepID=G8YL66_PICSO|nr:Piso0_001582 [Millerozyma farinosa CBS 7064]